MSNQNIKSIPFPPSMDPRPRLGLWAPGNYVPTCIECGKRFIGDKRAHHCADCAYALVNKQTEETTEERDPQIDVIKGKRLSLGGCSSCNDQKSRIVYEIRLGNSSLRVCAKCRLELIDKLKKPIGE